MADKRISMPKLLLTGPLSPENLLHSYETAAEILDLAPTYIFRLINEGHLQRVYIIDQRGREIGRGVTYDSVEAYKKRERKPRTRRQADLPLGAVD